MLESRDLSEIEEAEETPDEREARNEDAFARAFLCRGVTAVDVGDSPIRFFHTCAYCGCEVWGAVGDAWAYCAGCGAL